MDKADCSNLIDSNRIESARGVGMAVGFIICLVLSGFGMLFVAMNAHVGGVESGIEKMQLEAVLLGYGEYKPDKEGRAVWAWKPKVIEADPETRKEGVPSH